MVILVGPFPSPPESHNPSYAAGQRAALSVSLLLAPPNVLYAVCDCVAHCSYEAMFACLRSLWSLLGQLP